MSMKERQHLALTCGLSALSMRATSAGIECVALALMVLLSQIGVAQAQTAGPEVAPEAKTEDRTARLIVEKADHVRFPATAFEVSVTITSKTADGVAETRKYNVLSKGNENTIVLTTEPAADRGQAMLMKGRDLWIFLPAVSQPVRLSLSQRLTGQVANGDVARANFAGDYAPKLLRTEVIDGEVMHVLELTAVDRGVTYARVMYWVRQGNHWPYKAEFYAVSDRLLKTAFYQNYAKLGGQMRPTRMVMKDAMKAGEESVLDYRDLRSRDLPDRMFTKDYLKRVE